MLVLRSDAVRSSTAKYLATGARQIYCLIALAAPNCGAASTRDVDSFDAGFSRIGAVRRKPVEVSRDE